MNSFVVDVDQDNAQQILIEESQSRLVLVVFWAEWCAHCKTLIPLMEQIAQEYEGRLLFAKINAEEQQMLASQLGVQSLPTTMIFKEGQPVDGFAGAQPDSEIRALIDKHLPEPWIEAAQTAQALLQDGEVTQALDVLQQAPGSGEIPQVLLLCADCFLRLNRLHEAKTCLEKIKLADQDDYYKTLLAKLELQSESAKSPEIELLESQLKTDPDNLQVKLQLGIQYSQNNHHAEALENLFGVVKSDLNFNDGEAKKLFLDMLATLGKADPLAIKYQRKYYTLLY